MNAPRSFARPFIVSILQTVPAYPSGSFEQEVVGFAEATREAALERAARVVALLGAAEHATGPGTTATRTHRAVFKTPCPTCHLTGKKPGCKKKLCEACGGYGTIGEQTSPF